ncbi:type IVB secretion system protein IcmH/DotU [Sphingomonas montanisoli]|uniref:Type IV / VI secretion system DotU domain-containing protein n=1 Tax=Sphingomonas montanisoli TaxID=2606412 RepID=A0A5D9C789_9SPHN|nr:type IVB secretion system protein IcmH/DotU [Sphingomonas montanisoli]TZG27549.1 hypothetical protein FYJ91_08155 [Sphingomonas montanisoli]
MSVDGEQPAPNRTVFRPSPLQGLKTGATQFKPATPVTPTAPAPSGAQGLAHDDVPAPATAPVLRNTMMGAAAPLLALVASVRAGRARVPLPDLNRRAAAAIGEFDAITADYYPEPQCAAARYALCATVDDIVGNLPGVGADGDEWKKRSMVVTFVKDDVEEDRFWKSCDNLLARPDQGRDLIELHHACIAAGYEGRFHRDEDGATTIRGYMDGLAAGLEAPRAGHLVRQWRGQKAPLTKVGFGLYIALAALAAAVLLIALYVVVGRA